MEELRKYVDSEVQSREVDPPDALCCPITTQIMRQPVKTPLGHIYDRPAITQWVVKFHSDPMTRAPLDVSDLVPDPDTKAQVEAWREVRPVVTCFPSLLVSVSSWCLCAQKNGTYLRGVKLLEHIFSIEWSFGVGWALKGKMSQVCRLLACVFGAPWYIISWIATVVLSG